MEIKSTLTNRAGQVIKIIYKESNPLNDLEGKILQGVHAYCFCNGKLVVVYADSKGYWTPPGGGIEAGESVAEAVAREVKEETNMKVLRQELIGYQDIYEVGGMVRKIR